jgi:hypothetical protein
MITQEQNILDTLDHSKDGTYCTFIWLGNVYSFLIDCRLNIFRGGNDKWVIAAERLGYNPRAGAILLEVSYYGNCLTNLEKYNNQKTNYYHIYLVDKNSFQSATNDGEGLNTNAEFILVRGQQVTLSHDMSDYDKAGIKLKQYERNEIHWEEAARLLTTQHRNLFRATDEELYKSIPTDLKKILVVDEWYHKDFELQLQPTISDEHLRQTYEFNKNITGASGMDLETFAASFRQQQNRNDDWNKEQWNDTRPSANETWQLLAKVISTGDTSLYKPTSNANTHWTNWEESGSM